MSALTGDRGPSLGQWIDFGFFFTRGSASWRVPISLQVVFVIFIMALVLPLPESPRSVFFILNVRYSHSVCHPDGSSRRDDWKKPPWFSLL